MERKFLTYLCVLLLFSGFSQNPYVGIASWYSESDPGINLTTANGEIFDGSKLTCASWNFPFGTYLRVTYLANGRQTICRVNDRGPAKRLGRMIDLTRAAFQELAPLRVGLISVNVEVVPEEIIETTYKNRFQREGLPLKSVMPDVKSFLKFSSPHKSQNS